VIDEPGSSRGGWSARLIRHDIQAAAPILLVLLRVGDARRYQRDCRTEDDGENFHDMAQKKTGRAGTCPPGRKNEQSMQRVGTRLFRGGVCRSEGPTPRGAQTRVEHERFVLLKTEALTGRLAFLHARLPAAWLWLRIGGAVSRLAHA
jgi:hypothetical protein